MSRFQSIRLRRGVAGSLPGHHTTHRMPGFTYLYLMQRSPGYVSAGLHIWPSRRPQPRQPRDIRDQRSLWCLPWEWQSKILPVHLKPPLVHRVSRPYNGRGLSTAWWTLYSNHREISLRLHLQACRQIKAARALPKRNLVSCSPWLLFVIAFGIWRSRP